MFATRSLKMKHIARIFSLFGLLLTLSVSFHAQQKDTLGWQDARWGMSETDIVRVFDSKLKKLPKREVFVGRHVDYVIPEFEIEDKKFTVFFQMDDDTNKLAQVLIRLNEQKSRIPREPIFNKL